MSQPDSVAQLLEAAVPPIPASLRTPPYQRIRRRALRRRLAVACSAGAVIVVLAAAGAVATVNIRRLAPSTLVGGPPVATVDPSPSLPDSPVSWRVVRVDRAGTGLTVYVNPPPRQDCRTYPNPTATVDEGTDIVTITMTAKAVDEECSRIMATPVHLTLSRPLLDRKVRDGNDGVLGIAVQERDLPTIPPLWIEVSTDFTSMEGGLTIPYTRSGGPDLIFGAQVGTAATTGPTVRLGTRNGVIVQATTYVGVQWQVGDMVYSMRLMPNEGETSTVAQLHGVIDQLTWP